MPKAPIDNMPDRIEIIYRDAIDNIQFNKRQQWQITNYAILVYASIVAIRQLLDKGASSPFVSEGILIGLTWVVFVYSLYVQFILQRSITKFRKRLNWIYFKYFSYEERVGLGIGGQQKGFLFQGPLVLGLFGVLLFGAIIVTYYLYENVDVHCAV
ncbi:MAG: hypothetical protein GC182_03705 [Rhodopseudomonas sp.]|nr:hypothetical protein [Rhodopseudomonas sp.]